MGCNPSCCNKNKEKNCISIVFDLDSPKLPLSVLQGFAQVLGNVNNQDEVVHNLKTLDKKVIPSYSTQDEKLENFHQDDRKLLKKSLSHKTFEEDLLKNKKIRAKARRKTQKPSSSRNDEESPSNII